MMRQKLICVAVVLGGICGANAHAQRVFRNSRPVGGGTSRFGTGTYNVGQGTRWGRPAQNGVPSGSTRSDWTLRPPTYNNSRSVTPMYDAWPGRSTYRVTPPPTSYGGPVGRRSYSRYYGRANYGYYNTQPYGPGYPGVIYTTPVLPAYGNPGFGYGGVIAPPIVLPYGGLMGALIPSISNVPFDYGLPTANGMSPAPILPPAVLDSSPVELPGESPSKVIPSDVTPVVGEFAAPFIDRNIVTDAVDRVQSLRYQSSGDQKFRQQDYPAAVALYQQAVKVAPLRRGAWFRLTWSQLANGEFEEAAINLKHALALGGDAAESWISVRDLYGTNHLRASGLHSDNLWDWLQERPNSTDRLMLVAAFQQLRGYNGMANELFQEAKGRGLERVSADGFSKLAKDLLKLSLTAARPTTKPTVNDNDAIVSPLFPADQPGQPQPLGPKEKRPETPGAEPKSLLTIPK